MAQALKRTRRRSAPPPVDRVHAKIDREVVEMWALYEETGRPAPESRFPNVVALYYAAEHAVRHRRTRSYPSSFVYHGKRYKLQTTNLGRLRVLCATTGKLLIVGNPFALD